jgi:hypothetical protein
MLTQRDGMCRRLIIGVMVSMLALSGAGPASGAAATASPSPKAVSGSVVIPPWLAVKGRSLADWQRAYFKWTSGIPIDGRQPHPGLTEGQVDCSYAQRGPVWFLEAGSVRRTCSVPFGNLLYVPVNFWFCLPEADQIPFPECGAEGDPYLEDTIATLTLDGRRIDLRAWRTDTGRFTLRLADQNIWELLFGGELGRTTNVSSDGMGALVLLLPGSHTVTAGVTFDFDGDGAPDTVETSYEITVQ